MKDVSKTGVYIYCVIEATDPLTFAVSPIGSGKNVYTVHYRDLGAVVSISPLIQYSVSRENTIAHQKVLETVLTQYTLLPTRFGTLAHDETEISENLLKGRYKELKELLKKMASKNQVGLKVFWPDMNQIFQEIVEENQEINELKKKLAKMPESKTRNQRIELGRMVEAALTQKKEAEKAKVMKPLQQIAWETKESDLYGDQMFVSANFLVEKSRQDEFDAKVNELAEKFGDKVLFKYVGPVPPYNFVEIIFNL